MRLPLPIVLPVLLLTAQAQTPVAELPPGDLEAVVTTELGEFRFEFAHDKAPRHAELFIRNAREGFYDGSAFHRVFPGSVIIGGDPLLQDPKTPRELWGSGGLNLLQDEISDVRHEPGVVSTVRIPDKPDSGGAQFFVCIAPQPALDGQYSAFGRVTEGMDVVERISKVPLDSHGLAEKPVRIRTITIERRKTEPFLEATPEEMRRTVTLETDLGTIRVRMEPDWAPEHVRNFLKLVATGWYNGTAFHRISPDFVVQGGNAETRASGNRHPADRWVRPLKGEFRDDVKHERGILSMARTEDPDSATTSFFLMLGPAPHLDGRYSAFGRVVDGMEILETFEKEEVDDETPRRRIDLVKATIDPE
jgi:cyclophilin family peptidyl-prolyl cis-trans isomerase